MRRGSRRESTAVSGAMNSALSRSTHPACRGQMPAAGDQQRDLGDGLVSSLILRHTSDGTALTPGLPAPKSANGGILMSIRPLQGRSFSSGSMATAVSLSRLVQKSTRCRSIYEKDYRLVIV